MRGNDGRPVFLLMGLHHAREWPSGEHAIEFAFDLAKNFGRSDRITALLKRARVIVVPVVNVDGFQKSVNDGMLVDLRPVDDGGTVSILGTPANTYKRKNCRVVDGQRPACGRMRRREEPRRIRDRRRPQPQLRRLLGRARRIVRPVRPDLPRRVGVLRTRDQEHSRLISRRQVR